MNWRAVGTFAVRAAQWQPDAMTAPTGAAPAPTSPAAATTPSDPTATPHQTLEALTKIAGRGYTVVRNNFVQVNRRGKWVGSSLGRLVQARRHRAVLAYLLLLMVSQPLDKRAKPLEATVWARALSPDPPAVPWPETAMTPVWSMLEDEPHKLVEKKRQGRLVKVTPRKENGRGTYAHPRPDLRPADEGEKYFILPDVFWLEGWHHRLSLPGVAVLLIILAGTHARDEAWLSPERADEWYGISTKTMRNGLEDLRKHGLLTVREEWVAAGLSAIGKTKKNYYSLNTPFRTDERLALQETARAAAKKREAGAARKTRPRRRRTAPAATAPPTDTP